MSSHFSPKSLLFYGTMIGSVAILFRVASWYGEANLKAPPAVSGLYLSEQSLPNCPESTQLAVTVQQSGVYLHGALRLIERSESTEAQSPSSTEEDLTLSGLWQQQQLSLTGDASLPAACQVGDATANSNSDPEANSNSDQDLRQIPILIQGTISDSEQAELTGEITLGDSDPSEFTAVRAAPATQPNSEH